MDKASLALRSYLAFFNPRRRKKLRPATERAFQIGSVSVEDGGEPAVSLPADGWDWFRPRRDIRRQ
jgi:hypothetical protein